MAVRKKKVTPRVRQGMAGIPLENFEKAKYYIHYELDKKPTTEIVKTWIKKNFSKDDARAILANADYFFHMYSHYATGIVWETNNLELPEKWANLFNRMREFYGELIEPGKKILAEKEAAAQAQGNVVVLTPHQRLQKKVNDTIMYEIDDLEDEWIEGKETDFDIYNRMRFHDLKGAAIEIVRKRLEGWFADYDDAYNKKCEQAVEGYSHLSRKELKRRLKVTESMLADLDKLKATTKAVRTRVKKPKAADKQVARVKYCKENNDYKLASINPVLIVGAMRLFTFNAKTRVLAEYVSGSSAGFEVSGTSIKKFDVEASRQTRLRKPDDILPDILKKTPKQIDNIFNGLSTKIAVPNGRLNDDTIILRALDK
jgi:hypothetical protein